MAPNCKEHEDCDLVCICEKGYYCQGPPDRPVHYWRHVPWPDMPDDPEAYYNERAEERP